MQVLLILTLIVIASCLYLLLVPGRKRRRPVTSKAVLNAATASAHPYRAVSICNVNGGCAAAESMLHQRFLMDKSPALPLPDCNAKECKCRYVRYPDRREPSNNRRVAMGRESGVYTREGLHERRGQPGRRKTDWAMAS